jgi:hypothetical protein
MRSDWERGERREEQTRNAAQEMGKRAKSKKTKKKDKNIQQAGFPDGHPL